jgi:hypothetical protein
MGSKKIIISENWEDGYKKIQYTKVSKFTFLIFMIGAALTSTLLFSFIGIPILILSLIVGLKKSWGEFYINKESIKFKKNGPAILLKNIISMEQMTSHFLPGIVFKTKDGQVFGIQGLSHQSTSDAIYHLIKERDFND